MSFKDEMQQRAQDYAQRHGLLIGEELGYGVHGIVFLTESQPQNSLTKARSAIKIHRLEKPYQDERNVYLRLKDRGVTMVGGCHVPQLLRYDDTLWVIEMTVVKQPFVLDFADAQLDAAPDFSEEVMADWRAEKHDEFGKHWPAVQNIIAAFQIHGVFLVDVRPSNIAFAD
jgi:hypothetical protein